MRWLIDLTRAWKGTEELVFLEATKALSFDPAQTEVLATVHQDLGAIESRQLASVKRLPVLPTDDQAVAQTIQSDLTSQGADVGAITVMSFRPMVRQVVESLAVTQPTLRFMPLGAFVRNERPAPRWPEEYLPRQEAVARFVEALRGEPWQRTRKSDLRAVLRRVDDRFAKNTGTPANDQHFISGVVALAKEAGVAREVVVGDDTGNPWIELIGHREVQPESSHITTPPNQDERLSDAYITALRTRQLGPFQEVRLDVYAALDDLVKDGNRTPTDLARDAVRQVKETAGQRLDKPGRPFPWSRVRLFLIALLNLRPVLLQGETVLSHSWTDANRTVDGIRDGWQAEFDGALVCALLEEGLPVGWNEIAELSGALYNSRRDECCDRIIEVLRLLVEQERVTSADGNDGTLQLIEKEE